MFISLRNMDRDITWKFTVAAMKDDMLKVKEMLQDYPKIELIGAFNYAARNGHLRMVKYLLHQATKDYKRIDIEDARQNALEGNQNHVVEWFDDLSGKGELNEKEVMKNQQLIEYLLEHQESKYGCTIL